MTAPVRILMVEDNAADAYLTRETLVTGTPPVDIVIVADGVEACDFLRREPPFEAAFTPELILLDLNLPRMHGRQVLDELCACPALRSIPVIVFTSSNTERDLVESYGMASICYVVKPIGLDAYREVVRGVVARSLNAVRPA